MSKIKIKSYKPKKIIKPILSEFELQEEQIKEIIENKHYIPITLIDKKNKLKTTYTYKSTTKKFIYYRCKIRNKCLGNGKIDIKKSFLYIN